MKKSKVDFVFSGLGAAVGLGNVLRFPGACANYGGAFLIVTFFAMFFLAFPMLLAEVGLGRKREGGAVYAINFSKFSRNLGWSQSLSSMLTAFLYAALAGWIVAMMFTYFTFDGSARGLGGAFFDNLSSSGGFSVGIFFSMLFGLGLVSLCLLGGMKIISKTAKIAVIVAVGVLGVLAAKGISLCGVDGLKEIFLPKAEDFLNGEMWLAALGQVFFSLSVAVGVMPRFGSQLKEKKDVFPSCLIIVACDYLVSVLATLALNLNLSALNLSSLVTKSGLVTAFSVYPVALKYLFGGNRIMGNITAAIFYFSLFMLAVQAASSFAEAFLTPIAKRFSLSRKKCVGFVFLVGTGLLIVFATPFAKTALEIADLFLNFYGVLILALMESLLFLLRHRQAYSSFGRLYVRGNGGRKLFFCSSMFSVGILSAVLIKEVVRIVVSGFDYSTSGIITLGLAPIVLIYVSGFILTNLKQREIILK